MKDADVDAWLDRIEPRVIARWEAFDRIRPIGESQMDQRFKVLAAWFCTMLGSKAYQPDDIKGITPEIPEDLDAATEAEDLLDDEISPEATSADILRDYREQSLFR